MKQKIIWTMILVWFLSLVYLLWSDSAHGEKIMLQWDAVPDVDGYYIYQTIRGGNPLSHSFNYLAPIATVPQDTTQLTVDLPGESGQDTKYMFVARSYRADEMSIDSNEVSYVVCLVPPYPASELSGSYNKDKAYVHLTWEQTPDTEPWRSIDHWIIYYRIAGTDWIPIGRIDSDHELKMDAPFDAVGQGEREIVDFVIVTYRRSGIYSENSNILSIDVDRRGVPPVQNLRINVDIPIL